MMYWLPVLQILMLPRQAAFSGVAGGGVGVHKDSAPLWSCGRLLHLCPDAVLQLWFDMTLHAYPDSGGQPAPVSWVAWGIRSGGRIFEKSYGEAFFERCMRDMSIEDVYSKGMSELDSTCARWPQSLRLSCTLAIHSSMWASFHPDKAM